ncbi:MAG: serine/threonine-protein kinase [Myxococcota bacterium]
MSTIDDDSLAEAPTPSFDALDLQRTRGSVMGRLFGEVSTPVEVGGYEIVGLAGSGAMGRVYVAEDPRLGRKVALKLIRPEPGRPRTEAMRRRRLGLEARALARLSHPNIVEVLDVGEHDEQVYVVMELVEGQDLRAWLQARARTLDEVLDVFIQAAAGLCGAHAQGVVHRDFKLDNVRVGLDGRVRLVDFGLARSSERRVPTEEDVASGAAPQNTGIVGTPLYMAPELAQGQPADTFSDQYAFAVALHVAVHRRFPRAAPTESSGQDALVVPRWLSKIIERGLQQEPGARFPSMDAMRRALLRAGRGSRLRVVSVGAVAALIVTGAVLVGAPGDPEVDCAGPAALTGTWDDDRRAAVTEALDREAWSSGAAETPARVLEGLDRYASEWSRVHRDNCEATHVRAVQSPVLLDSRNACLVDRRRHLAALVDQLEAFEPAQRTRVRAMVMSLPALARCSDIDLLSSVESPPPDPALQPELDVLADVLARSGAMHSAGRFKAVAELLAAHLERARAIASVHPTLAARLIARAARMEQELARYAEALPLYEEAFFLAQRAGEATLATRCAAGAMRLHEFLGSSGSADAWHGHARAMVESAGSDSDAAMELHWAVAWLSSRRGDLPGAIEGFRSALTILEGHGETHGHRPDQRARILDDLADTQTVAGDYDEAFANASAAYEIFNSTLGPQHPDAGISRANLAHLEARRGNYEKSNEHLRFLIDLWSRELGPEHDQVVSVRNGLALNLGELGKHREAEAMLVELVEIAERNSPEDAVGLALLLDNVAVMRLKLGRFEDAEPMSRRALSLQRDSLGDEHRETGRTHTHLATILQRQGKLDEATEHAERALAITLASVGPGHVLTAQARKSRALIWAEQGRIDQARAEMGVAIEVVREALGAEHELVGKLQAELDAMVR